MSSIKDLIDQAKATAEPEPTPSLVPTDAQTTIRLDPDQLLALVAGMVAAGINDRQSPEGALAGRSVNIAREILKRV